MEGGGARGSKPLSWFPRNEALKARGVNVGEGAAGLAPGTCAAGRLDLECSLIWPSGLSPHPCNVPGQAVPRRFTLQNDSAESGVKTTLPPGPRSARCRGIKASPCCSSLQLFRVSGVMCSLHKWHLPFGRRCLEYAVLFNASIPGSCSPRESDCGVGRDPPPTRTKAAPAG